MRATSSATSPSKAAAAGSVLRNGGRKESDGLGAALEEAKASSDPQLFKNKKHRWAVLFRLMSLKLQAVCKPEDWRAALP